MGMTTALCLFSFWLISCLVFSGRGQSANLQALLLLILSLNAGYKLLHILICGQDFKPSSDFRTFLIISQEWMWVGGEEPFHFPFSISSEQFCPSQVFIPGLDAGFDCWPWIFCPKLASLLILRAYRPCLGKGSWLKMASGRARFYDCTKGVVLIRSYSLFVLWHCGDTRKHYLLERKIFGLRGRWVGGYKSTFVRRNWVATWFPRAGLTWISSRECVVV